MVSNRTRAELASPPLEGIVARYVARGCEQYRINGRDYRLGPDQIMLTTQPYGAEAEITGSRREGTLGLCLYFRNEALGLELSDLEMPFVLPASCDLLGEVMSASLKRLLNSRDKQVDAVAAHAKIAEVIPATSKRLWTQFSALELTRTTTKVDSMRKIAVAQAYLQENLDRSVSLHELSLVAGVSRFHLLRMFKVCLGKSPSVYHRELRLKHAVELAREKDLSLSAVADRFGFAGVSSLSHAYRRAFGTAPVRSLPKP
jgi:AraC-like DNA-binding protein